MEVIRENTHVGGIKLNVLVVFQMQPQNECGQDAQVAI
jgi:hypothetical protein